MVSKTFKAVHIGTTKRFQKFAFVSDGTILGKFYLAKDAPVRDMAVELVAEGDAEFKVLRLAALEAEEESRNRYRRY
jgi:hypothetical protein